MDYIQKQEAGVITLHLSTLQPEQLENGLKILMVQSTILTQDQVLLKQGFPFISTASLLN